MASKNTRLALSALALTLVLGACAVPQRTTVPVEQPVAPRIEVGTEWVAFAIDGVDEISNPKPRLLWINSEQVSGTGGCNAFSARSAPFQGGLRIGPLQPTGKPCATLPGAQEDLFFKAIELTRQARIERGQLILIDEAGKALARFQKAD